MAQEGHKELFRTGRENDEFLASLLHDIKSPILSINRALENKLEDELLSDIYNISLSTLQFIENLLCSYSFADSAWRLKRSRVDVSALLNTQLLAHKYLLKSKNINVKTTGFSSTPRLVQCPVCLERVFSNLLSNAHKYSPKNGEITICAKFLKDTMEFEFANYLEDGSVKLTDKIFEKFHTSQSHNSGGLGLYICKKVLEVIGGSIAVKNNDDRVSFCVRVKLPD